MGQNMEAVVGLDVDADDLVNELQDLFKQAEGLIGDAFKKGSRGGGEGKSEQNESDQTNMFSSMFQSMKGILGFVGKIFAGVSIGFAIIKMFEPIMKTVGSFIKIIAEFLRPISDILIILLAPILNLLRPLLITFKGLMAPFKQAAMQGMAAANQLIGEGMKLKLGEGATEEDKAKGGVLIKEGFEGMLDSAGLMLSGFFSSITDMMGLDLINEKIQNWTSNAIAGTMKVVEKADLLKDINLENIDAKSLDKSFIIIEEAINTIQQNLGGFEIGDFKEDSKTVSSALEDFKENVSDFTYGEKNINQFASDLNTYVGEFDGEKSKKFLDTVHELIAAFSSDIPAEEKSAQVHESELKAIASENTKSWFNYFTDEFSKSVKKPGLSTMLPTHNLFKQLFDATTLKKQEEELIKQKEFAYIEENKLYEEFYGNDGKLNSKISSGFSYLTEKLNSYKDNVIGIGDEISKAETRIKRKEGIIDRIIRSARYKLIDSR